MQEETTKLIDAENRLVVARAGEQGGWARQKKGVIK